jgi:hypothetical protein
MHYSETRLSRSSGDSKKTSTYPVLRHIRMQFWLPVYSMFTCEVDFRFNVCYLFITSVYVWLVSGVKIYSVINFALQGSFPDRRVWRYQREITQSMQIKFQTANSPPAFNKSNTFRGYFTGMLHVFTIGYWHSIRRVPLEEQELPTLPEHLSSPPVVSRSLVLCVCFVDHCLLFCFFSFCHCLVCPSSIYGFWLPLWWILIDMLKLPWCTQLLTSFFYKIKKAISNGKYM